MVGTMAKIDDSVKKKVPELRFKGFTDEWEERKLGEVPKKLVVVKRLKVEILSIKITELH